MWFQLAADQGNVDALRILRDARLDNDGTCTVGTRVVAGGLRYATDYNGRTGTIVQWMATKARYKVDFDGAIVSINPANLMRV